MSVGSETRAICKKCGDVWHVVIALVDQRIAKVECRECGARHRYRAATGEKGAARARPAARSTGSRARKSEKREIVEADESRPRRAFSMSETYEVGDRVTHPNFGEGVVQQITAPTKIVVLFHAGEKTLVHGRRAG
jgi:predicted  nucleic acid-binding Zn-ribbon protein